MFVQTLGRDWVTEETLAVIDLSERQKKAMLAARTERRLTTASYVEITGIARTTAKRDIEELVRKGVLVRSGAGRGVSYQVARKRPENGPIGPCEASSRNGP